MPPSPVVALPSQTRDVGQQRCVSTPPQGGHGKRSADPLAHAPSSCPGSGAAGGAALTPRNLGPQLCDPDAPCFSGAPSHHWPQKRGRSSFTQSGSWRQNQGGALSPHPRLYSTVSPHPCAAESATQDKPTARSYVAFATSPKWGHRQGHFPRVWAPVRAATTWGFNNGVGGPGVRSCSPLL